MKTRLLILLLSVITSVFMVQAQDRNRINAVSNDISDNLDLRAVADIFGGSRNLREFERHLNDPELQISNLDLNNDNEVDYLRVIETVDNRTHVVIIQSVLDYNLYQDLATIEIEKDSYNAVHLQIVGNEYIYGENYIYEPIYYNTPVIYNSFWSYNYRPYVSNWYWDYYPPYYYAWNPFPVHRYRNKIQVSLNTNNNYTYVNYRRNNQAVILYNSRRSNAYERQHPTNNFSRRNTNASNRYELEQRRSNSNEIAYFQNRSQSSRLNTSQRRANQRDISQKRSNPSRETTSRSEENRRTDTQNRNTNTRENATERSGRQKYYAKNKSNSPRENHQQRTVTEGYNLQNRNNSPKKSAPKRNDSQINSSQSRTNYSRENESQRTDSQREIPTKSAPEKTQNQRGNSQKNAAQRTESARDNFSRVNNRRP
jgi:hypothetical protein